MEFPFYFLSCIAWFPVSHSVVGKLKKIIKFEMIFNCDRYSVVLHGMKCLSSLIYHRVHH